METITNVINTAEEREDGKNKYKFLIHRLKQIENLETSNPKYHSNCLSKFYQYRPNTVKGRPISEEMSEALIFVINHIINNEEVCQFSLKEILSEYEGGLPELRALKKSLENHFGDEIKMYSTRKDYFICFRDSKGQIIDDDWYKNRSSNLEEERLRIVKEAAHIILQDIRLQRFDLTNYVVPTAVTEDIISDLPATLKEFVEIVVVTHKSSNKENGLQKWYNRAATIGHILMSAARPRAFISKILLGLSVLIHRKFASKELVNCLANIGLCENYNETMRFESSIMKDPQNFAINIDSFIQFIWDNADHNTKTIDGTGTFHIMGGIISVTPSSAVTTNYFLPLIPYEKNDKKGLKKVCVEKLPDLAGDFQIDDVDFLWLFDKSSNPLNTEGWLGFMNSWSNFSEFSVFKIIPLPFINAPASDENTILTALVESAARCKKNNQKNAFVTFDQPLYWKARGIIANVDKNNDPHNLSCIVVRLGGFHALMSFLGGIGYIMEGCGLKEVFMLIYAELSAEKALNGHAFARSIRGHLLLQSVISSLILDNCNLTEFDKLFLQDTLKQIQNSNFNLNFKSTKFLDIKTKFVNTCNNLRDRGPTAELWLQYFKMVTIVKQFYDAERSGNWQLHLSSMQRMIPYFHASGHFCPAIYIYKICTNSHK